VASAVAFIQWDNYSGGADGQGLFTADPLTFNSNQARLHEIGPGDRLWLVSRCSDDQQYYFVAVLQVVSTKLNASSTSAAKAFGEYAIVADRANSSDLGTKFPAEGLLRSLQFERKKPIRHGASIGQSLQSIRLLDVSDSGLLESQLSRVAGGEQPLVDEPFGLWTKCAKVFADYFLDNWNARREPLAFLLYDPPPTLRAGAPVFIHSEKNLRLFARFRQSLFLAGHKFTVDPAERIETREWVWTTFRAPTLNPPDKADYDRFWDSQNGIRSLFIMEEILEVPARSQFKDYGRALEWGYPTGVGYRYLTLSQTHLLLTCSGCSSEFNHSLKGVLG
jgi:hypothetical protein